MLVLLWDVQCLLKAIICNIFYLFSPFHFSYSFGWGFLLAGNGIYVTQNRFSISLDYPKQFYLEVWNNRGEPLSLHFSLSLRSRDTQSSHPFVHFPNTSNKWNWTESAARTWGLGPYLSHGWQQATYLHHHYCLPESAWVGNWSQQLAFSLKAGCFGLAILTARLNTCFCYSFS